MRQKRRPNWFSRWDGIGGSRRGRLQDKLSAWLQAPRTEPTSRGAAAPTASAAGGSGTPLIASAEPIPATQKPAGLELANLAAINLVDTAAQDGFAATSGSLAATNPGTAALTYSLGDATNLSASGGASFEGITYDLSTPGTYGTLYLNSTTGQYHFQPKSDWRLNGISASGSESFQLRVSDGTNSTSQALLVTFSGSTESPEQYVLVNDGAPLLSIAAEAVWEQALSNASRTLAELLTRADRDQLLQEVFGNAGTDAATFAANLQALLNSLSSTGLRIEVDLRSDAELNGALAAYAAVSHTGTERIYVNGDKLNNGQLDLTLTTSALLEEFGHALDHRLNGGVDSPGDEGQLFAAEVTGVVLTADQRALIDAENDSATLSIEGVVVRVENDTFTSMTSVTFSADTGTAGDYITRTASQTLTLDYQFNQNGGAAFTFYADTGNGTRVNIGSPASQSGSATVAGTFTATASITLQSGTNTLSIYTVASGGTAVWTGDYTLDTSAPTLSTQFPGSNATGIDRATSIILTFSEDIRAGGGTVFIQSGSTTYATITLTADATTGTFTGTTAFTAGRWFIQGNELIIDNTGTALPSSTSNINVDINTNAVTDLAGNSLTAIASNSSNIYFATGTSTDTTAPTISSVSYGTNDGALAVGESVTFSIVFGEVVSVRGTPTLTLSNGATAVYTSGDLTNTLVYTYTVDAGDSSSADITLAATPWGTFTTNSTTAITDLAGNVLAAAAGANTNPTGTLAVDNTPAGNPTISAVTIPSGGADNRFKLGDTVDITVSFSETVVVSGTPNLTINVGGVNKTAGFLSGSNSSTLTFRYTIAAGDADTNGISIAANAISLNSGTINDLAGNAATLSFNAVSDQSNALVDSTAPTLSTQFPGSNATGIDRATSIILTFSEDIRAGGGTVVIQSGSTTYATITLTADATTGTFTGTTAFTAGRWFIQGNELIIDNTGTALPSSTSNINVDINTNAVTDLAGNSLTAIASNSSNIYFATGTSTDTTAPTISSVSYGNNDGILTAGESVTFSIVFGEVVSVRGTPTLTLSNGATAVYTSGDLTNTLVYTYTVDAGDSSSADITLAATPWGTFTTNSTTAITDRAGNVLAAAAGANTNPTGTLAVDNTPAGNPTISAVTIPSGGADNRFKLGDTVDITVSFSETVVVSGTPNLTINVGGVNKTAGFLSGSNSSTLTFRYTIAAGDADTNGISIAANAISLNSGTINDLAGNAATLSFNAVSDQSNALVDSTAPTLSTQFPGSNATGIDRATSIILTFSEDIRAGGGTVFIQSGSTTYATITLTAGATTGTFTGTTAFTAGRWFIQGNELIIDNTGTALPSSTSNINVDINTNAVTDLAGNSLTAIASNSSNIYFATGTSTDTTAPTISSVTYGNNDGILTAGESVTFSIVFGEVVSVRGTPTLTLSNGATAVYTSGDLTNTLVYTYTVDAGDSSSADITLAATPWGTFTTNSTTAITDRAGNVLAAAAGANTNPTGTLAVDNTPAGNPTISAVTIPSGGADNRFKLGDTVDITVSFSETVVVSGTPNLTINVGGVNKTAGFLSGSNSSTLTFRYTIAAGDADTNGISIAANAISLNSGTINDLAGNAATLSFNAVSDQSNALVDSTAPTLSTQFPGSNATGIDRATSIILTFSEDIRAGGGTVFIQSGSTTYATITLTAGATTGTFTGTTAFTAGRWFIQGNELIIDNTGTALPSSTSNINVDINTNAVTDLAGNSLTAIASNSSNIYFATGTSTDTTAPTISSVSYGTNDGALAVGESVTFNIGFGEVVSVRGTPTLTLSNGATAIYTSGDLTNTLVYTYTVAAGDSASPDITLAATPWGTFTTNSTTAITDLAGNVLAAAAGANTNPTGTLTVDNTPPSAPTLSVVSGVSTGGATATEAQAGPLTVSGESGAAISVSFTRGATTITKNLTGTGSAQTVTLSSTDISSLGDGTISVSATQTDAAGNSQTALAATTSFTLDTVATPGTLSLANYTDNGTSSSDFNSSDKTFDLSLSGQESGATVVYQVSTDGGTIWSTTTTAQSNLSDGAYQFRAVVSDAAGNSANTNPISVTVDSTAPTTTAAVTALTDNSGSVTGVIASGGLTDDTTGLVVSGTIGGATAGASLAAGETLRIFDGASYLGDASVTLVSGGQSTWTFTDNRNFTNGQALSYTAQVGDAALNLSSAGTAYTASSYLGLLRSDAAPAGTLNASEISGGYTISIGGFNTSSWGADALIAAKDGSGNLLYWQTAKNAAGTSITIAAASLGNYQGTLSFSIYQGDAYSSNSVNSGAYSGTSKTYPGTTNNFIVDLDYVFSFHSISTNIYTSWPARSSNNGVSNTTAADGFAASGSAAITFTSYTLDSTATNAPTITSVTDDAGTITGALTSDGRTNDTNLTVKVTLPTTGTLAVTGDTIQLYNSSTALGSAYTLLAADITNGFANVATGTLTDGTTYSINAKVIDIAGNASTASGNFSIAVDTTAPSAPSVTSVTDNVGSITGTLTSGGRTDDTDLTVRVSLTSTNAVAGDKVQLYNTATALGSAVTLVAANITAGYVDVATGTLTDGTSYSINAKVIDIAGNASTASGNFITTVDATAPAAPTFSLATDSGSSSSDGVTNVGTINVTGVESNASWEYSTNSGTSWSTGSGSSFTLAAGTYAIGAVRVRQTDLAGNVTATPSSNSAAITVDATAPAAPTFSLATDSGSSSSDGVTNVGTINVTGVESNASWEYSTNSGTSWSTGSGSSFTLAAGTYAIGAVRVRQTDLAGNVTATPSSNSAAITVDATAPAAPTFSLATDSGSSSSDGVTNVGTINVTGVESNASWEYSTNSGTSWSTGSGSSFTLAAGTYAIGAVRVRQTDLAGNVSATPSQNAAAITVDATAPAAPTFSLATDSGSSSSDGVTNVGTINVTGVESNASWEYSTNSGTSWSTGSGSSFTLAAGTYAIGAVRVRQTDLAGNVTATPSSNSAAITVDATAPAAPTFSLATDSGSSSSDGVTNVGTINVSGVESNASWEYSTNSGTSWSTGSGSSFTLAAGTYAIGAVRVRQTDLAGNVSATPSQNAAAITVDATAPAAPTFSLATDSGSSSSDGVTNVGTINVTGVESNASWEYSTNSGTSWSTGSGSSFTLAAGTYAIGAVRVRQTDLAGNVSATPSQNAAAITVDATAPAAPTFSLATDSGSSSSDGVTNVGTINVTGVESNASWEYSTNSGTSWSTGSGSSFTLAAGTYAIGAVRVRQTDLAGNVSATPSQNAAAITVDATAPAAPSITSITDDIAPVTGTVSNGGSTNDTVLLLNGSAEANSTIQLFNGATNLGSTTANGSGAWTFTTATLTNGSTYSFNATATDAAGNVSVASSPYVITVDTGPPAAVTLTLGSGLSDGTTAAEATAATGAVSVVAQAGTNVAVSFSRSQGGSVTKNLIGSGAAQAVVLSTADLASLGDGVINVSAVASDAAGNTSAPATSTFTLDTSAPQALALTLQADTGSSSRDGITSNSQVLVSQLDSGTIWEVSTNAGSSWTTGSGNSFRLAEGSYSSNQVQVRQQDTAGNISSATGNSSAWLIDTTAPQFIAGSSTTAAAIIENSGSNRVVYTPQMGATEAATGGVLRYSLLSGGDANNFSVGTFSGAVKLLNNPDYETQSSYVFTLRARDVAGNATDQVVSLQVLDVDEVAPNAPQIAVVASDDSINGTEATGTVVISGTAEAGSLVTVRWASNPARTATATGGSWSVTYSPNEIPASGTSLISATAADASGNVSIAGSRNVKVDRIAPGQPLLNSVAGDNSINASERANGISLQGSAEAGSTVRANLAGIVRTIQADASGNWQLSYLAAELPGDGLASLTVTCTDLSGNLSTAATRLLQVDSKAPVTPTLQAVSGDNSINAAEAAAGIQLNGSAEAGSTVQALWGGIDVGSAVASSAGIWTINVAAGALPANGSSTLHITSRDAAGNNSGILSRAIELDLQAPTIPSINSVGNSDVVNAQAAENGVRVAGTAEAGSLVRLQWGDQIRSVNAGSNGTWQIEYSSSQLPLDGQRTITATAIDAAGNVSAAASRPVLIDTTPSSTLVTNLKLSADSGSSDSDFVTAEAAQLLTGSLSAALQTGETVQVSLDGGSQWISAQAGSQPLSFSAPVNLGSGDTTGTIQVVVVDAAGNAGAVRSQAYRLESGPNSNGIASLSIGADSGVVGDLLTNVSQQTLRGTLLSPLQAGERIQFRALQSNGSWSAWGTAVGSTNSNAFTFISTLQVGDNQLELRHLDIAGNASPTFSLTPQLDSAAPTMSSITVNGAGLDRDWQAGDVATIHVNFSESITVSGIPALTLSLANQSKPCTFAGNRANQLQFTYTISADDVANGSPVIAIIPGSLDLSDVAISDAAGNIALAAISNQLIGSGSADLINGTSLNDVITGAAGSDQLSGGLGSDLFVFRSGSDSCLGINGTSYDTITDFQLGSDQLQLETFAPVSSFKNLGSATDLSASSLGSLLNATDFQAAGFGAQFSVGSAAFLAVNDANPGFSAVDDLVVMATNSASNSF